MPPPKPAAIHGAKQKSSDTKSSDPVSEPVSVGFIYAGHAVLQQICVQQCALHPVDIVRNGIAGDTVFCRNVLHAAVLAAVEQSQHQLILHGFAMPKYGADGSFGSETHKSVCALQKSLKRPETGIAGKAEIEALHLVWKQEEQPGTDYEALYTQTKRKLERTEADLVTLQAAYDELMDAARRAKKLLSEL